MEWGTFSLLGREGGAPHQGRDPRDAFKPEGGTAIYRACMVLLKLGDKYSLNRLESACGRALQYTATPNYKTIQMILKTGSDLLKEEPETKGESYAFTRGAAYYGGGEGKC